MKTVKVYFLIHVSGSNIVKVDDCLSYIFLLRQIHPGLKIKDHFCQYDHIKDVRNYLLKLVNTKIVSRSETVPAWLFEDFYPSF